MWVAEVSNRTEIKHYGEITAEMLREAFDIPKEAEIIFRVPGGADWSNTDIPIDSETLIVVRWTIIKYNGVK